MLDSGSLKRRGHVISWAFRAVFVSAFPLFAGDTEPGHSALVGNAAFSAQIDNGWLVKWTNRRSGETFDFGKPAETVSSIYMPGAWSIPGYRNEEKKSSWTVEACSPAEDTLMIRQTLEVSGGHAQTVQWSLRLPLENIDGSYWPAGLSNKILAKDGHTPVETLGASYYFENRAAVISGHTWRHRYYIIQGKKGGLLFYVNDPGLEHFNAVEMDPAMFPREVVLTNRSICPPPWKGRYEGAKWMIVQYDGWVGRAAQIYRDYLVSAYDIKPLKDRATSWVQNLALCYVRAPFTSPPLGFPGEPRRPNYTENWDKNLELAGQWLENLAKVVEPDKVMIYVNWWRYYAMDTLFPEHSVDPFFALVAGKARKMGFHIMLHFHNHLAQDSSPFFGRYIAKQDEWHKAAYPNRPNAIGDPEGKLPWGVGYDFIRGIEVIQRDKNFGAKFAADQGLPIRMTGYHMSPAYEGWRYMKTAEILSAVRATCADAIHIDVPSVWPEGKERYGINSQQGSREFFKLLRNTLDNNGLSNVAVATEGSPGEGYMKYVDMAQLVRGYTTTSMLDGITAETMIELQVGSDYEKAGEARNSIPGGKSKIDKKEKKNFRFDKSAVGGRLAAMRSLGEPNIDAVIIAPFVRAYPHLGAATPLMGGYEKDPAAALHNLAAQALHTWATIQRDAPFNSSPTIQLFMDCPPWDSLEIIKAARKEAVKSGKRLEGRILNTFAYGEYALVRWWAVNQPRMAPPAEWSRGDAARYKLTDGKTLTARRSSPLCLTLAVDGQTLADIDIFEGWKNNAGLLRDYGPAFLADQVDGIGRGEK